jgi:hypothetical protein
MEHSMHIFARLVRLLLGETAIAERKLVCGHELVVLGVKACHTFVLASFNATAAPLAQVSPHKNGVSFAVCPEKAEKWLAEIKKAIEGKKLDSGCAQKLAGRLTWSTQFLFHKLGRAMIKPVYAQKAAATGSVGPRLLEALKWWSNVLQLDLSEDRPWHTAGEKVCRIFVDAASTPAYCAVVAFIDGKRFYTAMAPPEDLWRQLAARRDKQITSLEIIAILLAMDTFADLLTNRRVVLYSDNKGTQHFCAGRVLL